MTSPPAAQNIWALRRGAHTFLRTHAARGWEKGHRDRARLIDVPPALQRMSPAQRYRRHAQQEARRVADATLYVLRPPVTVQATAAGASLRAACRAGMGTDIRPPARTGLLLWEGGGFEESDPGVPLIACHWESISRSRLWVAWWADTCALERMYRREADARAPGVWSALVGRQGLLEVFGPLFYRDQMMLPLGSWPIPEESAPALLGLLCSTVATWHMTGCPKGLQASWEQPPQQEVTADRQAGLRPEPALVFSDVPPALKRR